MSICARLMHMYTQICKYVGIKIFVYIKHISLTKPLHSIHQTLSSNIVSHVFQKNKGSSLGKGTPNWKPFSLIFFFWIKPEFLSYQAPFLMGTWNIKCCHDQRAGTFSHLRWCQPLWVGSLGKGRFLGKNGKAMSLGI